MNKTLAKTIFSFTFWYFGFRLAESTVFGDV